MYYKFPDFIDLCFETDCAFSSDKKLLELKHADNQLTIYEKATGEVLRVVAADKADVYVDLVNNPTMLRVGLKNREEPGSAFAMLLIGFDVVNKYKEIEKRKNIIVVPR